jgi:ferritin
MRISEKVAEVINQQIHHELTASYTYLGMAAYFDAEGLGGFANWFRSHSEEENAHAMRLYEYLAARGVKMGFQALEAPKTDYESAVDVVKAALEHEQKVTDQIKAMFDVVMDAREYTAQPMLHWFLNEQIEEEELFSSVLDQVEAATSRFDLLQLDKELGQRAPAATAEAGE